MMICKRCFHHLFCIQLLILLSCLFLTPDCIYSQGYIRGMITDQNGDPLPGAALVDKLNPEIGTVADFDGKYSLKILDNKWHHFQITFIGYATLEDSVKVSSDVVVACNYVMKPQEEILEEVVITQKATRNTNAFLDNLKRNSTVSIDYISSETIKKTGDGNVLNAISRVSGVSTNGSFITVRGIGDRYIKTTLNGSSIPTLDSFTNNIKLDILPTSLINHVVLSKTASPELPGDWSGAFIAVETKDFPEELTFNVDANIEYNTQTSFKNIISSKHSSTDWLGFDNGFRDHDHDSFVEPIDQPNQYQQFIGLGMDDYYKSLGISKSWISGTEQGDALFKLGLVELGLLPKALFNDPQAFQEAQFKYLTGDYSSKAFINLNQAAAKSGQSFANNWDPTIKKAMPNFGTTLSLGNQINFLGKPLGYFIGIRYQSQSLHDPHAILNREDVYNNELDERVEQVTSRAKQENTKETYSWNTLFNLSYKITSQDQLSFLFMPNYIGVNNIRKSVDHANPDATGLNKSQFYESRRQLFYNAKWDHYFLGSKIKLDVNTAYTSGFSNAPDFKNLNYFQDNSSKIYQIGGGGSSVIQRYYRTLKDNMFDSQCNLEIPFTNNASLKRNLKFGIAYKYNNKQNDQYVYDLFLHQDHQKLTYDNIDDFLSIENFAISTAYYQGVPYSKMNAYYKESSDPANHNFGYSHIGGAYALIDYFFNTAFKIGGGIRVEKSDIFTDVTLYHKLKYPANDIRRLSFAVLPNPGHLSEINFLPSVSLVYNWKFDDIISMNLRTNYSYGITRPSIRELSETLVYDYEFKSLIFGNSNLKSVKVHNFDLKLEYFANRANDISLSIFYKKFKDHIELVNYQFYTWQNVDNSYVMGVELEGKVAPFKNCEFRYNGSIIKSLTNFVEYKTGNGIQDRIPVDTLSRTMFGQAPFVINGILSYQFEKIGLTASTTYNVQGPRLVISGISTGGRPDVYERMRHSLDCKISKKVGTHFNLSFTVKNILNAPVTRTFRSRNQWLEDFDRVNYGTSMSLGVSYKL